MDRCRSRRFQEGNLLGRDGRSQAGVGDADEFDGGEGATVPDAN